MQKHGNIIIPFGANPEQHELETARFFAALGKDVEFIVPSYSKGIYSPDIQMDGQRWEIKSPTGSSKRTIENNYRNAAKQSVNIVFDLRRVGLDEKYAISHIKQQFKLRYRKIIRIMIITKDKKLLDLIR